MLKWFLLILGILHLAWGCGSGQQGLPEIVLSFDDRAISMKYSDLVDSVEIIPLQTNDSILFTERCVLCVGEKYIIVSNSEGIYQFSRSGKCIRKMLSYGRGPGEYLSYSSNYIDERGYFYMTDGDGYLLSYDLEEGRLLGRYSCPRPMKILRMSGDSLLCYPDFDVQIASESYSLCAINIRGEGIRQLADSVIGGSFCSSSYISSSAGQIRMKTKLSDTVYTFDNWQKKATYLIRGEYTDHRFPVTILLTAETVDYFFYHALPIITKYDEDGKIESIDILQPRHSFRVNKENYTSEIMDHIYVDSLEMFMTSALVQIKEKYSYFDLSAFRFREALEKKAKKQPLSPELEKLYHEIKEDDNPLVVVGRNKSL